ncbi:MAG TPA: helix-turn-helix domain-containing protein, partial [Bacilli bacterium]
FFAQYVQQEPGVSLSFGIGKICGNPLQLHESYKQAQNALADEFFTGRKSINFYDMTSQRGEGRKKVISAKKIWPAYTGADKIKMIAELDNYLQQLKTLNRKEEIISAAMELLFQIKRLEEEAGMNAQLPDIPSESLLSIRYFSDLREFLLELFTARFDAFSDLNKKEYSPMIRQVIRYINKNFTKDISLQHLADIARANPSYLSRTFKLQTGENVLEYITKLRINKAKELLREGRLRPNEVALSVGYLNERYFSSLFKNETGCTPSEYRRNTDSQSWHLQESKK